MAKEGPETARHLTSLPSGTKTTNRSSKHGRDIHRRRPGLERNILVVLSGYDVSNVKVLWSETSDEVGRELK
jgi:hypothetical protein